MDTSSADLLAVVEAEAAVPWSKPGTIDDGAGRLFSKAGQPRMAEP